MAITEAAAERAETLALRVDGVVTVENKISISREITANVSPILSGAQSQLSDFYQSLPLIALGIVVFAVVVLLGSLLAGWTRFWQRILPNPFLAELVSQAVRIISLLVALIVSLNLIGATALTGAILGGAGVLGLAIGFAVRDGLENYISSVRLSIRQPFRANEHVLIDEHEGKVLRLTSRATVLMTLDGNHLRIPNSTVFKAVILNYTRNPERRFEFELGVDAEDDPLAAINSGIETIKALPFILAKPEPTGIITKVGDSNIVLKFLAWVDQTDTDFGKARGVAIARTKAALEVGGFSLPEPIYRLRLESGALPAQTETNPQPSAKPARPKPATAETHEATDVEPDHHLEEKVAEERAEQNVPDLLDQDRPIE